MILDSNLSFETAATFTAITTSRVSTNVLDMLNARDMGIGTPDLDLVILSNGLFAAAGAATLQVQFQGSADNSTYFTFAETPALSIATLNTIGLAPAANYILPISLPQRVAGATLPRYYRLNFIVATGPFTAGALQAYLALAKDDIVTYPAGYSTQYV